MTPSYYFLESTLKRDIRRWLTAEIKEAQEFPGSRWGNLRAELNNLDLNGVIGTYVPEVLDFYEGRPIPGAAETRCLNCKGDVRLEQLRGPQASRCVLCTEPPHLHRTPEPPGQAIDITSALLDHHFISEADYDQVVGLIWAVIGSEPQDQKPASGS